MRLIPDEDIEWIVRLLANGNTFEYVADEWWCSASHVRNRLREAGVVVGRIGIPANMPLTSPRALKDNLGHVDRPHALPSCRRKHLVVLPMAQYLAMVARLAELELSND